jgi:hypothetical protein
MNKPKSAIVKTTPTKAQPFDFETKEIALSKILLDPNNYRFFDSRKFKKKAINRFHEPSVQKATLESLEQSYQLDELKQSILTNGYVPMERVVVVPYPAKTGHYLVVEGNRRIASLKSLLKEATEGVLTLTKAQKESFSTVPCAILKSTGSALKHAERVIMGIRHIAGPKEWGAYQQALLVSELKDDEGQEFKDIGEMLGISSVEAARRYRAIAALKIMQEDDLYGAKAEPSFYRLFHELVSLPEVRERFGWSHDQTTFSNRDKAQEFFSLICEDGKTGAKLQTYGDVRKLKMIIGNPKAELSLFDPEQPFFEAVRIAEYGKKDTSASDLLMDAKKSLEQIGLLQVKSLKASDRSTIDELMAILGDLKSMANSIKKK